MGWCAACAPLAALLLLVCAHGTWASWEEWWTYDGISGPAFWGLINPQWSLCSKGRRQSPIDIEPDKLLFDPLLRPLHIDKNMVSGTLHNTGQTLVFRVSKDAKEQPVNITGGPLAYRYQFEEMYFHYGTNNSHGSEHRIHGYSFPGEIQLYGFNADLYHNMTEAQHKSQGIVGVSVMLQVSESPTTELRIITSTFGHIRFKDVLDAAADAGPLHGAEGASREQRTAPAAPAPPHRQDQHRLLPAQGEEVSNNAQGHALYSEHLEEPEAARLRTPRRSPVRRPAQPHWSTYLYL
ncbi:carbonic anhydrase-related protein 10-like isoform X2 [Schistocerca serialis cubense]|uniref:carbonic anhydrase-related protein 10-like isoform X2 n=1 Tax=Schistocerca serialis cubense TaxID=2023355 RepID=UPI00214F265F|nr:carbonic anhydrase-related protein 10-like isoform X2 [Schistocerca serialis cubense]